MSIYWNTCSVLIVLVCLNQLIQAERSGELVGVRSSKCSPLPTLEHGSYSCTSEVDRHETCVMKCKPGYMVPITQRSRDKKRLHIKSRGVYQCLEQPGGRAWEPTQFFDCVEAWYPIDINYYYALTLIPAVPCTPDGDTSYYEDLIRRKFQGPKFVDRCDKSKCGLNLTVTCVKQRYEVDFIISISFSIENVDNHFDGMRDILEENLHVHFKRGFTEKIRFSDNTTYIRCPQGSVLEYDLTCRGCSKGHFLDGADMECSPCPTGFYQDETHQIKCKQCPPGAPDDQMGLKSISECFHVESFVKRTSIVTVLAALASVVIVAAITISYRSQVRNEPDGKSPEYYPENIREAMQNLISKPVTMVPEVGTEVRRTIQTTHSGSGDTGSSDNAKPPSNFDYNKKEVSFAQSAIQHKKLRASRMSLAGLAVARLAGAVESAPKKPLPKKSLLSGQVPESPVVWEHIHRKSSARSSGPTRYDPDDSDESEPNYKSTTAKRISDALRLKRKSTMKGPPLMNLLAVKTKELRKQVSEGTYRPSESTISKMSDAERVFRTETHVDSGRSYGMFVDRDNVPGSILSLTRQASTAQRVKRPEEDAGAWDWKITGPKTSPKTSPKISPKLSPKLTPIPSPKTSPKN